MICSMGGTRDIRLSKMTGYFSDIKEAKRITIKRRKKGFLWIPVSVKIESKDGTIKILKLR